MKRVRRATLFASAALFLVALIALVGCDQKPDAGPVNLPTQEMTTSDDLVIGTPGNGAEAIEVCNRTGQTISEVFLKVSTEEAYGQPIVSQGWNNEQTVKIYFSLPQTALEDGSVLFDAQLTLADGSIFSLSEIDLLAMKQVNLRFDEASGLLYFEGISALGQPLSTLKQSIEAKAAEEEAARLAEEQALAEAEAAAAEAAAASAASSGGYSYNYNSGGSSGSGSLNQSSDVCLDDILLR
jgi:hypothetical protein